MTWAGAAAWRESVPGQVVFTNGVFDLIHRGHVDLLTTARSHGDALIVGINSDDSTRRLKGPDRPARSEQDRAYVLAALEAVDAVVIFHQDTPAELISLLRPDVLVKGGDYSRNSVVGAKEVQGRGGRVIIVPLTTGHSTTAIIQRLRDVD